MSGLYIPGIHMPETCSKCRDSGLKFTIDNLGLKCPERKEIWGPTDAEIKGIRRADCPLVSVEDHGDLIDGGKFFADINESVLLTTGFKETFNLFFDDQPTVIPGDIEKE